jgi:import inner membrane translocase subunit TIM17
MKVRAPIIGGSFANWGGVFSCYDCSLVAIRNKNDAMNSIASGGLTGFTLAIRSIDLKTLDFVIKLNLIIYFLGGLGGAIRSGIAGCVILAMIEGVQIAISRMIARYENL